jgi:hypothetical protein
MDLRDREIGLCGMEYIDLAQDGDLVWTGLIWLRTGISGLFLFIGN